MYVPTHVAPDDHDVQELLASNGAADLVTDGTDGLEATMLQLLYERDAGRLLGHFARNNDHWKRADGQQAPVIVRGPDSSVSPSWNYVTAHAHGTVTIHDEVSWLEDLVRRLPDRHEAGRPVPWQVVDAPERFFRGRLRAIVGVDVRVERVEAMFKLSQNRPGADIDGVIDGLRAVGDGHAADAVAAHRP